MPCRCTPVLNSFSLDLNSYTIPITVSSTYPCESSMIFDPGTGTDYKVRANLGRIGLLPSFMTFKGIVLFQNHSCLFTLVYYIVYH